MTITSTGPAVGRKAKVRQAGLFAIVITIGVAVQTWAALQWSVNFDSDEAIFGLMARHILQGHIPTYYYGQRYLGSLDAILSAPLIHWLGNTVPILRITSVLMFGLFPSLHGLLVHRLWGRRVALVSLLVLPGWQILIWTYRPIAAAGVW